MSAARENQRRLRVVASAMALLALLLRVAWPVPMPAGLERDLAAVFGEHALCLSGAPSGDPARMVPFDGAPTTPGGHTDHDASGCCQWHAAASSILPGTGSATRIAFATCADRFLVAAIPPPGRRDSPAQARAPPA